MKTRTFRWMTVLTVAAAAGLIAGVFTEAQASIEVEGRLYKKGSPEPTKGKIQALPGSGKYVIVTKAGAAEVRTEIEVSRVDRVEVPQPKELAAAIRQVNTQPGAAIPVLKKIAEDYVWLGWDLVATRYLLDAYLKSGRPGDAVKVGNDVLRQNKDALSSADFLTAYVDAMIADNKEAGVANILSEAIQKGSREVAAVAHVKRGNILKKNGNVKEALVQGFLRTTEMFQEQKDAQPEALYQAARCFEELGQGSQAEKMRRRLLKDYDGTPWAEKIKTGK